MPLQPRKYRTQWASTFFAAGELTRRGYLVTLTHGNAKFVDLLVQSPNGKSFSIDVKGMSTRSWIPVSQKPLQEGNDDQYYILVYTPKPRTNGEDLRYFIMSSKEMHNEMMKAEDEAMRANEERERKGLQKLKSTFALGIAFKQAEDYENKWVTFPGYEQLLKEVS